MTIDEAERNQISGHYGEVLRESQKQLAEAEKAKHPADAVRWGCLLVEACRRIGRSTAALNQAYQTLELAKTLNDPALLSRAHFAQAAAFRAARDFEGSLHELKAALEALPAEGGDPMRAEILLETAEASLEAGFKPAAETALAKGGALVHWLKDPRLLAWSLYLRSQWEAVSPADLQLSAAYEIAKTVDCPELKWQILWRLSSRAREQERDKMEEDCLWNAFKLLNKIAEPLEPADAETFWRMGLRRAFLDSVRRKFGSVFLERVMQDGPPMVDNTTRILRDLGFDSGSIPEFGRGAPPQAP